MVPYELKCATITSKMKVAKVRVEPKTIGAGDLKASARSSRRCRLSSKLSILFEPCYLRQFNSHFLRPIVRD